MDAYNRGYGAGISGLSQAEGTKVGSATIEKNAEDALDEGTAKAAGFYGISYKITDGSGINGLNTGDTVISYRGTNASGQASFN